MFKKIMLIFSFFLVFHGIRANNTIVEFERALQEKSAQTKTIVCDFKQVRSSVVFANDDVKAGKFTYVFPENILLAFQDGDYIKMRNTDFAIRNAGTVTEVKVTANPMLKELKRLLSSCMTGDVKAMSSSFNMNVTETDNTYIVVLTPMKGRGSSKMKSVNMCFDKKDMSLSELMLTEPSGDSMRYDFFNKKFNVEVSEELFSR